MQRQRTHLLQANRLFYAKHFKANNHFFHIYERASEGEQIREWSALAHEIFTFWKIYSTSHSTADMLSAFYDTQILI